MCSTHPPQVYCNDRTTRQFIHPGYSHTLPPQDTSVTNRTQNETTAGTSHQHQVPDLTAQEDAPHHKPLDNWDIAPSPLSCFNKCNKSASINSLTSGRYQTSIHQGCQVTQTVSSSSQYTEGTHHLCTVFGSPSHHECPTPLNLSLVDIAAYTMTITLARHNS